MDRRVWSYWFLGVSLALFCAALFVFPFLLEAPEPDTERFTLAQSFLGGTTLAALGLVVTGIKYWHYLLDEGWLPTALAAFLLLSALFSGILYLA
ncbi:hypothetical protein [Pelagibacterium limicola]|uniref:hypothetical protein n=1 Tax=Pelagibacterium limicola TaxID=2791022 RepID=UPI0018AFBA0B|nr:hypothetical protein [Pelagibacterium limicola]